MNRGLSMLAVALALGGCSGGAAPSGGSGSISGPAPTPAPAPTPTPTPTPTPSPILMRVVAGGPVSSTFYFFTDGGSMSNSNTAFGYGTRDGIYRRSFAGRFRDVTFGPLTGSDLTAYPVSTSGIESGASTLVQFRSPAGARIASPLATLIFHSGNQTAVKHALQLDAGGTFRLFTNPDLLQFDPMDAIASADTDLQNEGRRVLASNLRAMTLAAVVANFGPRPLLPIRNDDWLDYGYEPVGTYIAANPDSAFFSNATTLALLRSRPGAGAYRDDVLSAAAHLINDYCLSIGVLVNNREQIARFTMGLQGYLIPALQRLLAENSAAAASAVLALNNNDVMIATEAYLDVLPFNQTGYLFPGPDFISLPPGGTVTLPATSNIGGLYALDTNDFTAIETGGPLGIFPGRTELVSVTVPAAHSGQVTAVRNGDGTITITAAPGFNGVTSFDYRVRSLLFSEEQTGRVYVRIVS